MAGDTSWTARVGKVQDHVRRNLDGDLHLDTLARVVGASRFHFARVCQEVTGETLAYFVRRARLERAAALMQGDRERKLLDIALEVGLGSAANFARVFRRHFGGRQARGLA